MNARAVSSPPRRRGSSLRNWIPAFAGMTCLWCVAASAQELPSGAPRTQAPEEAEHKSSGCESCHTATDRKSMHNTEAIVLGCTDCHGGDASVVSPKVARNHPAYEAAMRAAHVPPRHPERDRKSTRLNSSHIQKSRMPSSA